MSSDVTKFPTSAVAENRAMARQGRMPAFTRPADASPSMRSWGHTSPVSWCLRQESRSHSPADARGSRQAMSVDARLGSTGIAR